MIPRARLLAALAVPTIALAACGGAERGAPRCDGDHRMAIVAQSVPGASFVPCIATLPAGWTVRSFEVDRGGAALSLRSDRADRPVEIDFDETCDVEGSTAVAPRDDGVRTFLRVTAIAPRYAGKMFDVFPGGCVTYAFDFDRGPHIALTDELRAAVALYPRRELRRVLHEELGVDLD